jgi:hypothetical protein
MIANWTLRIIVAVSLAVIAGLILSAASARAPGSEAATRDQSVDRGCAIRHLSCGHEVFYGIPVNGLYLLGPEDLLS